MRATVELHWLHRKVDQQGNPMMGTLPQDRSEEVVLEHWRRDRVLDYNKRVFEHIDTRPDGVWVYRDQHRP